MAYYIDLSNKQLLDLTGYSGIDGGVLNTTTTSPTTTGGTTAPLSTGTITGPRTGGSARTGGSGSNIGRPLGGSGVGTSTGPVTQAPTAPTYITPNVYPVVAPYPYAPTPFIPVAPIVVADGVSTGGLSGGGGGGSSSPADTRAEAEKAAAQPNFFVKYKWWFIGALALGGTYYAHKKGYLKFHK